MDGTEQLNRLNTADRPRGAKNLRPRDAASLILIDSSGDQPRLLVGKRHPDQVFLPNKIVFPGGRVDPSDTRLRVNDGLKDVEQRKLLADMKGRASPSRAQGLALAAVRELFEETGLVLGAPNTGRQRTSASGWRAFLEKGYIPHINALTYFARATTPPRRPRRYDTRFFVANARHIAGRVTDGDGELSDLNWLTFDETRSCDLHAMTATVLDEVEDLLDARTRPKPRKWVPHYYEDRGVFCRTILRVD